MLSIPSRFFAHRSGVGAERRRLESSVQASNPVVDKCSPKRQAIDSSRCDEPSEPRKGGSLPIRLWSSKNFFVDFGDSCWLKMANAFLRCRAPAESDLVLLAVAELRRPALRPPARLRRPTRLSSDTKDSYFRCRDSWSRADRMAIKQHLNRFLLKLSRERATNSLLRFRCLFRHRGSKGMRFQTPGLRCWRAHEVWATSQLSAGGNNTSAVLHSLSTLRRNCQSHFSAIS